MPNFVGVETTPTTVENKKRPEGWKAEWEEEYKAWLKDSGNAPDTVQNAQLFLDAQ